MTVKFPLFLLAAILASSVLLAVQAEPEPAKALPKYRSAVSVDNEHLIAEARQAAEVASAKEEEEEDDAAADGTPGKADASSGRLFLKKFLLFRNIFGNSNSQPVIPIIITGAGTGGSGSATNPTSTITSTGTIPSATGTITTSPASRRSSEDEDEADNVGAINEQALQAALAAGAQEYVVTDDEIKGTSDGKASKKPGRINLKRKGAKKGQVISVRIPPRYRQYFSNGQKVMLNTNNRPSKRRVVKKRVNGNRRRVNRNKRRRVVPV